MKKAVKQSWMTSLFGTSAEEHDENLNRTLKVTKESGLKLNKEICKIKKDRLTYFGHVLSADEVSPDPQKVEAITELQAPTNQYQNYAELLE